MVEIPQVGGLGGGMIDRLEHQTRAPHYDKLTGSTSRPYCMVVDLSDSSSSCYAQNSTAIILVVAGSLDPHGIRLYPYTW